MWFEEGHQKKEENVQFKLTKTCAYAIHVQRLDLVYVSM